MRRVLTVLLAVLLTAATLRLLFSSVNPSVALENVLAAQWPLVAIALLLFASVQWLRAWRFSLLTTGALTLPALHYVTVAFRLNFLNFVVPFRAGELGYPIMMHRERGESYAEALSVLLVARLFDLAVVGTLVIGFAAWFGVLGSGLRPLGVGIATLVLALPTAIVLLVGRGLHAALPGGRMHRLAEDISVAVNRIGPPSIQLSALVLTAQSWICFGVAAAVASRAVAPDIPLLACFFSAAAGNLAFALPVNGIAGLGTSQAAWVLAATWAGVAWEPAVVSATIVYLATLASALAWGALGFAVNAVTSRSRTAA
jgi:hypothetical protein